MKKVVITGSRGTIGSVLSKGLVDAFEIVGLDLPEKDISNYNLLLDSIKGADVVVHLAGNFSDKTENWRSGNIEPKNVLINMNAFKAVVEVGVRRLIMASSVHADDFPTHSGKELLTVDKNTRPTGPYGAHKLMIEALGRHYVATNNLEFIGIRFGGVSKDNKPKDFGKEPSVWLSHRDCIAAVGACIDAEEVPNNYVVFYAVSDNDGRLHDTSNPFGWEPKDNSADYLG